MLITSSTVGKAEVVRHRADALASRARHLKLQRGTKVVANKINNLYSFRKYKTMVSQFLCYFRIIPVEKSTSAYLV